MSEVDASAVLNSVKKAMMPDIIPCEDNVNPVAGSETPLVSHDFGPAVVLSDAQSKTIDEIVTKLFALSPNSPEFNTFTDQFHTRVPTNQTPQIETTEASNADLGMELLDDLRNLLDYLLPKDQAGSKSPHGEFSERLDRVRAQINDILIQLDRGKKFILDDLEHVDAHIANYQKGIGDLRLQLVSMTALRTRVERLAERVSPSHKQAITENVTFYLTQREMDLLTEIAVVTQAYLAMAAMRKTNVIMRVNVDRVLSTTVQALKNAVFVATNIKGSTLNYAFDTRMLVTGFHGKEIKQMVQQFVDLDRDLKSIKSQFTEAKALPNKKSKNNLLTTSQKKFYMIETLTDGIMKNNMGGWGGGTAA